MAKSKKRSKKSDAKAREKAAAKPAVAAEKKRRAKADSLAADAKKARKAADRAVRAADKAEAKAAEAARAAGREGAAAKPDELELARLALRAAEARLTATEIQLERVQRELDDERRLQDEAVQTALEDAIVDAAVAETVGEAIDDAVADAEADDQPLDALVVEAVAVDLDEVAEQADLPPEEPTHEGEAEAAAAVFADATGGDEPAAEELTPPLPDAAPEGEPSGSWTLLQLRQEAKRRGLTGTSNLPKAALLERLQP